MVWDLPSSVGSANDSLQNTFAYTHAGVASPNKSVSTIATLVENPSRRAVLYSSHPVSLAAALATIEVYEDERLIENAARLGPVMRRHHEALFARHPSVGAHRNLGLFGILDLVRSRDPFVPMTPFNGTSDEMKAIGAFFREAGLYTMIANNSIHTNPPLSITEEQLDEGFAIIDRALDIADRGVAGA